MLSKLLRASAPSSRLLSRSLLKSPSPPRLAFSNVARGAPVARSRPATFFPIPPQAAISPISRATLSLRSKPPSILSQPLPTSRPFSSTPRPAIRISPILSARYYGRQQLISPADVVYVARHPYTPYVLLVLAGGVGIFYFTNIEEVPFSKRRRFNCFSQETVEAQSESAYRQIYNDEARQGKIMPEGDRRVAMVERVLGRLIEGGGLGTGSVNGRGWEVSVIDDPDTANAFVLPGGKVFVYSGILPICENDDGLAAVLGHEIAHNLAHHSAEKLSSMVFLQPLVWILRIADQSGYTFGFGEPLGSLVLDLGVMKPSSREQESEADYIGLLLMSQSCYDPQAAVGLWQRMEESQKKAPPEWLSTHPSNLSRVKHIQDWLPEAKEKRLESGCAVTSQYMPGFQNALRGAF